MSKNSNTEQRTHRQQTPTKVNRLIDTKDRNRISGKPLKTRDPGTLVVAGIPYWLFYQFENQM